MIGTPIKIKNHDTGEEITLNDHSDPQNVIALQSFPSFETDIRAQNLPRQGAHGEVRLPTYYSGMSIVLQGVIAGEDEAHVWAIKKAFDDIMRLPRGGFSDVVEAADITPALAINECINPTGQVATTGWDDIDATLAISGNNSIEVETDTADASGIEMIIDDSEVAKDEGDEYAAAADIENNEVTARTFRITIQARNSGGSVITSDYQELLIDAGETERLAASLTLPANTADIKVLIQRMTDDAVDGDIFHVSNVLIAKNLPSTIDPETDYFDGNTPDLSRLRYEWIGQEGLSASQVFKQTFPSMFRNSLRLSFTNPYGKEVFIDATPIKAVSYDRPIQQKFLLNFQIILRSNFPVLLIDDAAPIVAHGELGSQYTGFQLPTQLPFSLGEQHVTGSMVINMETPGFAILRMYGSDEGIIVNPKITNLTNGDSVQILKPLLGSEKYFEINGVYQTMKDDSGQSVQQYSNGDFVYLEAGENVLLYTADRLIAN